MVKRHKDYTKGFTIIELMIALSVLSTILLIASAVMINIGKIYNKGVNVANLQNANRTLVADVSQSLQFGGTPSATIHSGTVSTFCIGTTRYNYILGKMLGPAGGDSGMAVPHVLWRDTIDTTSVCPVLNIAGGVTSDAHTVAGSGYDMVSPRMRLNRFQATETPAASQIYTVEAWMAYGDSNQMIIQADGHTNCNGVGQEFCATSHLSTTVARRVN